MTSRILRECGILAFFLFLFLFIVGVFTTNVESHILLASTQLPDFFIFHISRDIANLFFFIMGKSTYFMILVFFPILIGILFNSQIFYRLAINFFTIIFCITILAGLFSPSAEWVEGGIIGNFVNDIFTGFVLHMLVGFIFTALIFYQVYKIIKNIFSIIGKRPTSLKQFFYKKVKIRPTVNIQNKTTHLVQKEITKEDVEQTLPILIQNILATEDINDETVEDILLSLEKEEVKLGLFEIYSYVNQPDMFGKLLAQFIQNLYQMQKENLKQLKAHPSQDIVTDIEKENLVNQYTDTLSINKTSVHNNIVEIEDYIIHSEPKEEVSSDLWHQDLISDMRDSTSSFLNEQFFIKERLDDVFSSLHSSFSLPSKQKEDPQEVKEAIPFIKQNFYDKSENSVLSFSQVEQEEVKKLQTEVLEEDVDKFKEQDILDTIDTVEILEDIEDIEKIPEEHLVIQEELKEEISEFQEIGERDIFETLGKDFIGEPDEILPEGEDYEEETYKNLISLDYDENKMLMDTEILEELELLDDIEQAIKTEYLKEDKTSLNNILKISNNIDETENLYDTNVKIVSEDLENILEEEVLDNTIIDFEFPSLELLKNSEPIDDAEQEDKNFIGEQIVDILKEFNIHSELEKIIVGPVVTRYEIKPPKGLKVNKITELNDNIALGLASKDRIRIEAPVFGKSVVGIEVPNLKREVVTFKDIADVFEQEYNKSDYNIPFLMGKSLDGDILIRDLVKMPHLLIAGSTGSGKSVCVNTLINSILYYKDPSEVKLLLVDPKRVELILYDGLPHLITPVIKETPEAIKALKWLVTHMEERYTILEEKQVRNIGEYNQMQIDQGLKKMPYIVVIMDEFADLILLGKREVEESVIRLAAMARAVGIHLVLATQRPSADVITGLIKANFPSRIAFKVSSKMESRIILDENGAENLLGKGDMLFLSADGGAMTQRIQSPLMGDEEVRSICNFFKARYPSNYWDEVIESEVDLEGADTELQDEPLFREAVEIIVREKKASASYLQRRLKVGYNRAARMIETMEDMGIISRANGSKPREILIDEWEW